MDANFDQLEHAWKIYLLNHRILRVVDQKLQFLLAIALGLAVVLIWVMIVERPGYPGHSLLLIALFAVYFVALLWFFYHALRKGLFATTDTVTRDMDVARLIFFKHINERDTHPGYYEDFLKATREDALKDLVYQVREISFIVVQKYIHYNKAWSSLNIQLVLALAIVLVRTHGY